MCKSMNALFCSFMDKEQESSFWANCPEVQIKNEGGHLMYSKNGIPWVRPPTQDRQHRENNIGRTEQWSMN